MWLTKLLPVFFSPLALILILLTLGLFIRRRWPTVVGVILLFVLSLPGVINPLFSAAQGDAVRADPTTAPTADAIIVLGGSMSYVTGTSGVTPEWGDSIDRFFGGLDLLRAERAPLMIFSGGSSAWHRELPSEGELLADLALKWGVDGNRIKVAPRALNTAEEATLIRALLPSATGPKILLVTSAFHMSRAKMIFESVGFEVVSYPVDLRLPTEGSLWEDWLPSPSALSKVDLLVTEMLGRAYYSAIGVTSTRRSPSDSKDP
jgi:uncharacterized SAM-binding protein YcdF (DUF218 family)